MNNQSEREAFEAWVVPYGVILTDVNPYALATWDAFQAGAAYQREQLKAKLDDMEKDVARYRWLCEYGYFRAMSMDMGGNHSWAGSGRHLGKGESIDAAMGSKGNE